MIISGENDPWLAGCEWRSMADYDGKSVVMLRSDQYAFLGMPLDGVWTELLDGEIPHPGFEPTHWAEATEQFKHDYMLM